MSTLGSSSGEPSRVLRGLVGVVHLAPMPSDPAHTGGSFDDVIDGALGDVAAWLEGGVATVVVENFGSAPFWKGTRGERIPPHQTALLALVAARARREGATVGVNCLRNDGVSAVGVAAAAGAAFVRVNVLIGAYVTDQGLIEGEAADLARYRRAIGFSGEVFADVLVKHASPLGALTVTDAVHDTLLRGGADAVVVSGRATGASVDRAVLAEARDAAGGARVFLGSGLTPACADALCPLADGAFVGTWAKKSGDVRRPVDAARVRALVEATAGRFRRG